MIYLGLSLLWVASWLLTASSFVAQFADEFPQTFTRKSWRKDIGCGLAIGVIPVLPLLVQAVLTGLFASGFALTYKQAKRKAERSLREDGRK